MPGAKPGSIREMLDAVRAAVGRCKAPEAEVLEELLTEAEGWKMRLDELADERRAEGGAL